MFENVVELLKKRNLVVPGSLFFNLGKLGINYDELYFLIYIMNLTNLEFDMVRISKDLNIKVKDVMKIVNDLNEKNLLKLDIIKKGLDVSEFINIDGLYQKMAFITMNKEEEKNITPTVFDEFEKEFKRPLTPREFQIINTWKDVGYLDETILLALKEASYNGVYSIAYIDKILNNWDKKGIRTKEEVEKNREEFASKKEEVISMEEDYDWLNEQ
ncbi:MAG TPA: DnaD domain protein [Bacilli bacterium]|nr:DnaD domain protein [Bacilli bacterium]